jgi:hypothetical protein
MVALVTRMRWPLVTVAAGLLATEAGCFYVDPINERPSADIVRIDPQLPGRGDPVEVVANIVDPDGDPTTISWQALACGDSDCDPSPFQTYDSTDFYIDSPKLRADGSPATRVHVKLDVVDSYGARAEPPQQVDINLEDAVPVLEPLQVHGPSWHGSHTVGQAVSIVAHASDADDDATTLVYDTPTLFPPPNVPVEAATLTPITDDPALGAGEAEWELTASQPGDWQVKVSVSDPLGASATYTAPVPYALDQPPCLGASDPQFTPAGARIVVDSPRLFAVDTVDDDLDPFPGSASFRWYLGPAGGTLTQLANDSNAVDIDPSLYTPGDQLELRVEAVDRVDRPLCDASMPTCEAVPSCYQRETWYLEAR